LRRRDTSPSRSREERNVEYVDIGRAELSALIVGLITGTRSTRRAGEWSDSEALVREIP